MALKNQIPSVKKEDTKVDPFATTKPSPEKEVKKETTEPPKDEEPKEPEGVKAPESPTEPSVEKVEVEEEKPDDEKGEDDQEDNKVLSIFKSDLDALVSEIGSHVNSVKSQKTMSSDNAELIKLSALKLLQEAVAKLSEVDEALDEMRDLSNEMNTQRVGLDKAAKYIDERSKSYRIERDGFMKLKSMDEKEYYRIISYLREQREAEKKGKE